MPELDSKFYQKKKSNTFYIALGFFVLIVCTTAGLFFYTSNIHQKSIETQQKIDQLSGAIANMKSDSEIQIYSMYEQNKGFFERLTQYSQIPSFVNHLKKHFAKHDLEAKGFDYQNGNVTVSLSVQTNESGFAYQKIVKFIEEYSIDESARFTIDEISSFSWYDRINYTGNFTLK